MGGSSKKQTVGYKYYLGMHLALCHGPADKVVKVKVEDKTAWEGVNTGGSTYIDNPNLFGGESREGGIQGTMDIEMGEPSQGKNSYLVSKLGSDIPAFRGVMCAVLRQMYLGMNPYLKPWSFKTQRIHLKSDGSTQWYDARAEMPDPDQIVIPMGPWYMDFSATDDTYFTNGVPEIPENALRITGLDPLTDKVIVTWNPAGTYIAWSPWSTTIMPTQGWKNSFTIAINNDYSTSTSYGTGGVYATPEEARDAIINTPVEISGFTEIALFGSDTPLTDNRGGLSLIVHVERTGTTGDMNPAHIIREALTDTNWGMGYPSSDIDDASFIAAADTLWNEAMGISMLWDREKSIEDFISEVLRHIDATLYIDRITGKFVLKLIRNDYDENTIPQLGESNIVSVDSFSRPALGELINSVTVVYESSDTDEDASVIVQDQALIAQQGGVISTSVTYHGFTKFTIAAKAAQRDLKSLSTPLISIKIKVDREAATLNVGDVFKFSWPDLDVAGIVMRVKNIDLGSGQNNTIVIEATQDAFDLPDVLAIADSTTEWLGISIDPASPPTQLTFEVPYYEIAQLEGDTGAQNLLNTEPDLGYAATAATRPEGGLGATVWSDSGAGYIESAPLDFCPSAELAADVSRVETTFTFINGDSLDSVDIGSHGQIGNELFRVDAIDELAGTITVGRAVLDTVPAEHVSGSIITFWDAYLASDSSEYVASEVVNHKVLTVATGGVLAIADATETSVTMASRAIRPYRPANIKVDGLIDPTSVDRFTHPIDLTWVHRNRLFETGGVLYDWEDGTITPEVNTEYTLTITGYMGDKTTTTGYTETITGLTGEIYSFDNVNMLANGTPSIFIEAVWTTNRDGYDSYYSPAIWFRGDYDVILKEDTGLLQTEDGFAIMLE